MIPRVLCALLINNFIELILLQLTLEVKQVKVCRMKKDLHSKDYRPVVFRDTASGTMFLTKSTAPSTDTVKYDDGNSYPVVDVHISSASHPFYTGKEKLVDIEGRVDKFKARAKRATELRKEAATRAGTKKKAVKAEKSAEPKSKTDQE